MPRVRRKAKHRRGWTRAHVVGLVLPDFFRVFGDDEERRSAWADLRDEAFELLDERRRQGHQRLRPDAWWRYEAPSPLRFGESELERLEELGLATDEDRAAARAK